MPLTRKKHFTYFHFSLLLGGALLIGCGGDSGESKAGGKPRVRNTPRTTTPSTPDTTSESTPATPAAEVIAEGWGSIKGRFLFGGDAPSAPKLQITQDQEFCGKHEILNETLTVSADKGIANVVVYLYEGRGQELPEPHESYADVSSAKAVLDNLNCRFEPHVCVLHTSQTLEIKNSDEVGHNTNIAPQENVSFNQTIPVGSSMEHKFDTSERRPAPVNCNIHPWMKGWVLPLKTPYFAVSGADGSFEIKNLPAGVWTFQVWHESAGGVEEVSLGGAAAKWSKGRVEFTIKPDETNDLGDIELSPELFNN